jgi:uncharacterized membrane protein (DUF106 family)
MKGGEYMSIFKALFNLSNTNIVHKSIIVVSFLVVVAGIFFKTFFTEAINLFGPQSESIFALLLRPVESVYNFSLLIFIISWVLNLIINLANNGASD